MTELWHALSLILLSHACLQWVDRPRARQWKR